MRSKILIILIFVISFAYAHDLFINHFSVDSVTITQKHFENQDNQVSETKILQSHQIHHALHFDGVLASENVSSSYNLFQKIDYSTNFISVNPLHKLVRPPIV
jgi:hypothetical protein